MYQFAVGEKKSILQVLTQSVFWWKTPSFQENSQTHLEACGSTSFCRERRVCIVAKIPANPLTFCLAMSLCLNEWSFLHCCSFQPRMKVSSGYTDSFYCMGPLHSCHSEEVSILDGAIFHASPFAPSGGEHLELTGKSFALAPPLGNPIRAERHL